MFNQLLLKSIDELELLDIITKTVLEQPDHFKNNCYFMWLEKSEDGQSKVLEAREFKNLIEMDDYFVHYRYGSAYVRIYPIHQTTVIRIYGHYFEKINTVINSQCMQGFITTPEFEKEIFTSDDFKAAFSEIADALMPSGRQSSINSK